jgi:hypothetical protein
MRAFTIRSVLACGAAVVFAAAASPAKAQTKFDAVYTLSFAGIGIGKAAATAEIASDRYRAAANGRASGFLRILVSGSGTASAGGVIASGALRPVSFASNVVREDEKVALTMTFERGSVKDIASNAPPPEGDRVAVTDAHRKDVLDPLSALLVPEAAGQSPSRAACERTLPIFDGRRRFDLKLSFKRMDKVKADKGYEGAAVVCAVAFQPIAGHRTSSALVKYLSEGREIEIWLAPIAGTDYLAPFRLVVVNLLGNLVLQADQFTAAKAATTNAQAQ